MSLAAMARVSHPTVPLPTGCGRRILVGMLLWLLSASLLASVVLTATGGLSVCRYSGRHVVAQLAVGGRGLYFSRTPDGVWWRPRLRRCRRVCENRGGWAEPPPDGGGARAAPAARPRTASERGRARPAPRLGRPVRPGGADARGHVLGAFSLGA